MNDLVYTHGVRGRLNENGDLELNLEDVSKGLGFTQVKNGVEYVRWERVHNYLTDMGFPHLVGKAYIPENVFYRLAMKGENESAIAFQIKVADEILPTIRKTGSCSIKANDIPTLTAATGFIREMRQIMEKQGNSAIDVARMAERVCRRYNLPLPDNFIKESPFEQMTMTVNVERKEVLTVQ